MKTFLLKGPSGHVWCERTSKNKFYVINGNWEGTFNDDGETLVVDMYPHESLPYKLVWEGDAPFSDRDYNEAIPWILEQL